MITPIEARTELLTKGVSGIHESSALDWTTRALEAKRLFTETHEIKWAIAFTDLRHEALEHSILSENPAFPDVIRAKLQGGGNP